MRALTWLCAALAAAFCAGPALGITVYVNDRALPATPVPVEVGGRVLLPLRTVFEALGAQVKWDAAARAATAERDGTIVRVSINSRAAFINHRRVLLDVPAQLVRGTTYMPVRFPAEAFGANVDWNGATRTVRVTLGAAVGLSFPLNGGFERVEGGRPFAWEADGLWAPRTAAPYEGRSSVEVYPLYCKAGMNLTSSGYIPVATGAVLRLRGYYKSSAPGALAGIAFCDEWGAEVGQPVIVDLSPSASWRAFELEHTVSAQDIGEGVAGARPLLRAEADGLRLSLDAVTLSDSSSRDRPPVAPVTDPFATANLLTGAGGPSGEAAWLSPTVRVDASLMYEARLAILVQGDSSAPSRVLLRALEPGSGRVLLQREIAVAPRETAQTVALVLPALSDRPLATDVQVAVLSPSGVSLMPPRVSQSRLVPVPLAASVTTVAGRTRFSTGADVSIFVSAANNTRADLTLAARSQARDSGGTVVFSDSRRIRVGPRSYASFPVKPGAIPAGEYAFETSLLLDGRSLATQGVSFIVGN